MIATIVKHQWFSGSPLPLNEWFGRNHWYQWFFNGFWSINHWPRWFFSLATIGLDGFAMVFGLATIGLNGFSMVANHWSNDGMVTIHRYGLILMLDDLDAWWSWRRSSDEQGMAFMDTTARHWGRCWTLGLRPTCIKSCQRQHHHSIVNSQDSMKNIFVAVLVFAAGVMIVIGN